MSETFSVLEPATEREMAELPRAGVEETDAAVERAKAAFPAWRAVAPGDRAAILHGLAAHIAEHREELAEIEARNVGKPIVDARGEIEMVAETFRYYAAAPERLLGQTIPVAGGIDMTFREPLGVVGLIVPWNFPLTIASWKLAPALAAGNTVVLKPAELTPLSAIELERIALEAGLPEGVLNVVAGPGSVCGQRLVEHPDVAKVAFTGSTEVGRGIAAGAAATIKRVTLELGGKSANVVFADADIEAAAAAAPVAVFGNAGQDCCARSRILVERSALDEFMEALRGEVEALRVGDPLSETTQMGPLISAGQRELVASFVPDDAPVAIRGIGARRAGLLVPADGPGAGRQRRAGGARGDLRPGRRGDPVRGRGGGGAARQRHDLRPLGLDLDPGRGAGAAGRAGDRHRRHLDQLQQLGPGLDPVRRLQAVGRRPRARPRRARPLHRGQERLLRNRGGLGHRCQDVCRTRSAWSPAPRAGSAPSRRACSPPRAPASSASTSTPSSEGELSIQANVADENEVRDAYARVAEEMGRIDVLMNNAGINPTDDESVLDTPLEAWQRVQDVNLRGVFLCCKHGIPHLLLGDGGSVVNVASFVAVMGAAVSQISYTASKGGVLSLSRELGVEFARRRRARQRDLPGPGQHAAARGALRLRPREGRGGAWSTSRWADSAWPRRSRRRRCSSPATSPRS